MINAGIIVDLAIRDANRGAASALAVLMCGTRLTTRLTREDAHRFYERLGYTKNGFRYAKDLTGTDD